jgi:transmembrane sensor
MRLAASNVQPAIPANEPLPSLAPPVPKTTKPTTLPAVAPRIEPVPETPDWRLLAKQGSFRDAYRITTASARPTTLGTLDDLLMAADVARSSGHASAAIPYLERALELHPGDQRVAVAAFTLRRVLQTDLKDHTGAAKAFERARSLAPKGALAEDALAREVESRSAAGMKERARVLAEEYLRLWPEGRRVREVRHFGGLP